MAYEIGIINVWGTGDPIIPGDGTISSEGWYYLSVSAVQETFAQHNGCNVDEGPTTIETSSDGIKDWQCTGYEIGCTNDAYTIQCNYNGRHQYPKSNPNLPNSPNFALPVVWDYFKKFQRIVPSSNSTGNYTK